MVLLAEGTRIIKYYSKPWNPDYTEHQCSQGREKIQWKPHGTSENLKGKKIKSLWQKN